MCDFKDAFQKLPLKKCEKRHFVILCKGSLYIYRDRLGQGSLNGPTTFGRRSAFISHLSQSMVDIKEARMQLYIDDPIGAILASPQRSEEVVAVWMLTWMITGFDLAVHKAQFGDSFIWTGYRYRVNQGEVEVSIKESCMADLLRLTSKLLTNHWVSIRTLRSYTGCANHVGNPLFAWRPCLDTFCAATSPPTLDARISKTRRHGNRGQRKAWLGPSK